MVNNEFLDFTSLIYLYFFWRFIDFESWFFIKSFLIQYQHQIISDDDIWILKPLPVYMPFYTQFLYFAIKLSIFTFLAPNVTKISRNTHLCRSMLECTTSVNPINVIILDVHRLSAKSQTWYDTNEFIQERSHLDARCAESSSLPARISSSMFRYTIQTANAWITSAYLKDVAKLIYTRPAWRSIMWRVIITSTSRYSRSKRVS